MEEKLAGSGDFISKGKLLLKTILLKLLQFHLCVYALPSDQFTDLIFLLFLLTMRDKYRAWLPNRVILADGLAVEKCLLPDNLNSALTLAFNGRRSQIFV